MSIIYNVKNTLINSKTMTKHSYEILIENKPKGVFTATVLGWQDCRAEGETKEDAVNKLRQVLNDRLHNKEIVSLEIEIPDSEHPWMQFAGMFKDDPDFDDVLADIKAYRHQLDEDISQDDRM